MISLYLLPNKTRLVKAERESDGRLKILSIDELPSYWDALVSDFSSVNPNTGISGAAMSLSGMFREAGKLVGSSGEEFYIVLPDSIFCLVTCVREPEVDAGVELYAAEASEIPLDDLSIAIPFETRPSIETVRTVFAIPKEKIQRIVDAAGEEGVTLASVEPASVAFLRASGAYNQEHYFFFADSAVFVSYSPLGGIFRMEDPLLSADRLLALPAASGDMDLRRILADLEAASEDRFRTANDDVAVVFVSGDPRKYAKFPSLDARIKELSFVPDIISETPDMAAPRDWMASIGTFLQDEPETAPIFSKKPSYLTCSSGNLLPKGMRTNAKLFRLTQRVKKVSRMLLCFGIALLAIFPAIAMYFSSFDVPQDLQSQFEANQKELSIMEKELSLIAKAKQEHCRPITGFRALLRPRPETLGFTKVQINNGASGPKGVWMEADLVSKDPLVFQDYVASMAADKTFSSASIIKIGTDASGYKTATVTLRKGETE